MTVAKYEPAKNFGKEGYLSFRYRSPCEGWLYLPPLPTRIQASCVVSFVMSGSTAALAVQGPVVYLAPRLQVAVQGPEVVGSAAANGMQGPVVVFGSTAASGIARTSCCIGSTAASGNARTIRMKLAHTGRNTLPILFSAMGRFDDFPLYEGIIGVHFVCCYDECMSLWWKM
ncbi:hypothetical protein C2G38_1761371 [Gigaspora rosea]|uniref:Uncharacterized protein n=1 Tax=Gigaspora rosea TaxID=44941 RepID=A0A397UTZ0_9GLOM|nr:hypothetical protein C2G38_1761371 [Gigaspora rosea]